MLKKLMVVVAFLGVFGMQAAAAEVKIGVVDLNRAVNESDVGKKAKAELETLARTKQGGLDEKGKEIERLKADLEKQASVLSPEARKSKEEDLERMIREYQRLASDSEMEFKKRYKEVMDNILKDLRATVDKLGQEGGYTMIIENADGIILFSKKDINLTDAVIKRYNESAAKGKK